MTSILSIARNNRRTFYDFATGQPVEFRRHNFTKFFGACLLADIIFILDVDLVTAVFAMFTIITGFSFSMLFSLMGSRRKPDDSPKETQLVKLRTELFYNLSYLNLTSFVLIVWCLVYFLFRCEGSMELGFSRGMLSNETKWVFCFIYRYVFFILTIESVYSFFRAIQRASFYISVKTDQIPEVPAETPVAP